MEYEEEEEEGKKKRENGDGQIGQKNILLLNLNYIHMDCKDATTTTIHKN